MSELDDAIDRLQAYFDDGTVDAAAHAYYRSRVNSAAIVQIARILRDSELTYYDEAVMDKIIGALG